MKRILILIFLVGCSKKEFKQKEELTLLQQELKKTFTLEEQVLFEECMNSPDYRTEYCIDNRISERRSRCVRTSTSGNSVIETAAGTAIGIGAAKLILGK